VRGGTSLLCHQATPAQGNPKHAKALGLFVDNQFDPEQSEQLGRVYPVDHGQIVIAGKDIARLSSHKIALPVVRRNGQERNMTVR
jgi:hypothetical protein